MMPPTLSDKGLQAKAPPGTLSSSISLLPEPKRFGLLPVKKLLCLFLRYFLFFLFSSRDLK